jgi:propanediol dehydratase large subunit
MSGITTIAEQWTDSTSQLKSSQISIRWFKGETLNLDGKVVVDTVLQTQTIVKKVIWMNNEAMTMDWVTLVNTIH